MDETRAFYADLAARSKFTKAGERIQDTRAVIEATYPKVITEEEAEQRMAHSIATLHTVSDLIETDESDELEVG